MASTKKTNQLKVPGVTSLPQGQSFYVYEAGVSAYEKFRPNGDIELVLDDGTVVTGKVASIQVGPLIDLLVGTGPQAAIMVARVYSPLALVQSLSDQAEGAVIDVTKLYAAVAVQVPIQSPSFTPA